MVALSGTRPEMTTSRLSVRRHGPRRPSGFLAWSPDRVPRKPTIGLPIAQRVERARAWLTGNDRPPTQPGPNRDAWVVARNHSRA